MDWNALKKSVLEFAGLGAFDWSSLDPHSVSNTVFTILATVEFVAPVIWVFWTHPRNARKYDSIQIVRISAAQAVDMWYQDSRRYLEARSSMAKAMGTTGGLGIAASATLLATAGFNATLLYFAVGMLFLVVALCAMSQLQLSHTYYIQASTCAQAATGSEVDDQVEVGLVSPNPKLRKFDSLFSMRLAWWWLFAGWSMIILAIAVKSIPQLSPT